MFHVEHLETAWRSPGREWGLLQSSSSGQEVFHVEHTGAIFKIPGFCLHTRVFHVERFRAAVFHVEHFLI
jgi:hypothetical protein